MSAVSIGRQQEAQRIVERTQQRERDMERDFWNNQAPDLFCEAVWENLLGNRQACHAITEAMRTEDDAELGRLVRKHSMPYLDYQLEIAREGV